jgi:hypothetical protein
MSTSTTTQQLQNPAMATRAVLNNQSTNPNFETLIRSNLALNTQIPVSQLQRALFIYLFIILK